MKGKIYVLGLGPGAKEARTEEFVRAIRESQVVITYRTYAELIRDLLQGKEVIVANMKEELLRAKLAILEALEGKTVSIVSSGDPQVFGMASPTLELACLSGADVEVRVIPGVTAALAAAARIGAPLSHDFAVVSLSDLLTPREEIVEKVRKAAEADFVIALYNPINPILTAQVLDEVSRYRKPSTPLGIVRGVYRDSEWSVVTTLGEWRKYQDQINMVTTLIVGNSKSYVCNGLIITPRGYDNKYELDRHAQEIRDHHGSSGSRRSQGIGPSVEG